LADIKPWDLGTKDFIWDGTGRVFLSSSNFFLTNVGADNILTITGTNGGSKSVCGVQPALDITDILIEIQVFKILPFHF